jgi:hypothetical protein
MTALALKADKSLAEGKVEHEHISRWTRSPCHWIDYDERSERHEAAVGAQHMPNDERGSIGREPDDGLGNLFGFTHASQWQAGRDGIHIHDSGRQHHVGDDSPRRYGVDSDTFFSVFHRCGPCQQNERRL